MRGCLADSDIVESGGGRFRCLPGGPARDLTA